MKTRKQIIQEMKQVKCGDFKKWYDSLNAEEIHMYREEFENMQEKFEKR